MGLVGLIPERRTRPQDRHEKGCRQKLKRTSGAEKKKGERVWQDRRTEIKSCLKKVQTSQGGARKQGVKKESKAKRGKKIKKSS